MTTATPRPADARGLVCGAAEVDITPHFDLPTAGYSALAKAAQGVRGHLFARAIYLADGDGRDVAICVIDMMSASRYLLERAAAWTERVASLPVERLLLLGTHTHSGPGCFYGHSLYDCLAADPFRGGFDRRFADWVAKRIARAVVRAKREAGPALVGTATVRRFGLSRNRSLGAFRRNAGSWNWNEPGHPGEGRPPGLQASQRFVDPRVRALAAVRDPGDGRPGPNPEPIAVLGTFACHGTSLGPKPTSYSPDWPGEAAWHARSALEEMFGSKGVVVAVTASAAGDMHAMRGGLRPRIDPGPRLMRWVGERAGRAVASAAGEAVRRARPARIATWFGEADVKEGQSGSERRDRLSRRCVFGWSTVAGSEVSRSGLFGWVGERTWGRHYPRTETQFPKQPGLGWLQGVIMRVLRLRPPTRLPLHVVTIGDHALVTVPGEPTVTAAQRMERRLLPLLGARSLTVVGTAGEYAGYVTTRSEYLAQHYEGASTIFGRNTARFLESRLAELLASGGNPPSSTPPVEFHPWLRRRTFRPRHACPHIQGLGVRVVREADRVRVRWRMGPRARVLLAEDGAFAQLLARERGAWHPVRIAGRPFDDVHGLIHVERAPRTAWLQALAWFLDPLELLQSPSWTASFELPATGPGDARYCLRVAPRSRFRGFDVTLPTR